MKFLGVVGLGTRNNQLHFGIDLYMYMDPGFIFHFSSIERFLDYIGLTQKDVDETFGKSTPWYKKQLTTFRDRSDLDP